MKLAKAYASTGIDARRELFNSPAQSAVFSRAMYGVNTLPFELLQEFFDAFHADSRIGDIDLNEKGNMLDDPDVGQDIQEFLGNVEVILKTSWSDDTEGRFSKTKRSDEIRAETKLGWVLDGRKELIKRNVCEPTLPEVMEHLGIRHKDVDIEG
jgi:hypothetical protein